MGLAVSLGGGQEMPPGPALYMRTSGCPSSLFILSKAATSSDDLPERSRNIFECSCFAVVAAEHK